MLPVENYLKIARNNEAIFRSVLKDLKNNCDQRPGGCYIPDDLEIEASLEVIFEKYSLGDRYGIFTITDFQVDGENVTIGFKDVAFLSGGGAVLRYLMKNGAVEYSKQMLVFMS